MRTFDPLLEPFQLRHLTLRNRIVSTSHEPAYAEDGLPKDRYRLYHREKARGGVGLTMIGGSAVVARDSPPAFGNLLLYRDDVVPWLKRVVDDVHEAGAAVMCQVTHMGRRGSNYTGDWLPLLYPSAHKEPAHGAFPKVAEAWDLDRVVDDFVSAALRCQAAGLDGIEMQHYGHLVDAFLSPATNDRTDALGGSLEHRMAFPRRVFRAVRAAVGPDFLVGIRMSMDEDLDGGLSRAEALAALRAYVADGIDFLSLIKGTIDSDAHLAAVIPGMGTPTAPFLDFAGQVRREVEVPVMHAARISDVSTARHAVRDGLLDLVGMTRPQMADPYLVAKLAAGEEDRIRPCVGANYCLDAIYDSGDAKCIHNPATGREQTLTHQITPRRRHRADGGRGRGRSRGPGGRAGARRAGSPGRGPRGRARRGGPAAARRGLAPTARPGRDRRLAPRGGQHAGVEIRYGRVRRGRRRPCRGPRPGRGGHGRATRHRSFLTAGQDLVLDTWDVMDGSARPTGEVLVYDDNGAEPAHDAAELLARAGAHVELVTPERTLAPGVGSMNSPAYLRAYAQHDVAITLAYRLREVHRAPEGRLVAHLWSDYAEAEVRRVVDAVVVEQGTLPNDELYLDLVPGSRNLGEVDHEALVAMRPQTISTNPDGRYQLFRVGDAVTSRNVHAAIYDALRLCLAT